MVRMGHEGVASCLIHLWRQRGMVAGGGRDNQVEMAHHTALKGRTPSPIPGRASDQRLLSEQREVPQDPFGGERGHQEGRVGCEQDYRVLQGVDTSTRRINENFLSF